MNKNTFINFLYIVVILLIIINSIGVSMYKDNLLIWVPLLVAFNTGVFYGISRIKVYDSNNKPVSLDTLLGDVIGFLVVLVLSTIVYVCISMYRFRKQGISWDKTVFYSLLAPAIMYIALVVIAKSN